LVISSFPSAIECGMMEIFIFFNFLSIYVYAFQIFGNNLN
jgi:hypothetical protein